MARPLAVEITGNVRNLKRALHEARDESKKTSSHFASLKYAAAGAGAAIGTGLAIGLEKSISAAVDAQKSQARLEVAFKNARLQIGPYEKGISRVESASRRLGFTDEETKNALGSLITSTHSFTASLKQLAIAQDLARFKGVSLESATKALTMAHAGSLRPIKQLGIDVPKVTAAVDALKASTKDHTGAVYANELAQAKLADKAATFQNVLKATTDAVHGQAQAYSNTAAGAMAQFHAQVEHIEVAIGQKLLPVMTQSIIWIRDHWPQISAVIKNSWDQYIKPTLSALIEIVKAVVQTIRNNWSTIGPIVMTSAAIIKNSLKGVIDILHLVADLIHGDWSKAWHDFKTIVADEVRQVGLILKGIGQLAMDLIKGFVAAIDAGAKLVENAIKGLFHKVIHWAEQALGIASPSAVFHEIGRNSIEGFINGVGSMAGLLKKAVVGIVEHAASSIGSYFLGGGKGTLPTPYRPKGDAGKNRQLGMSMAAARGWTGPQWNALDALWNRESRWSNTAKNASSGAYGIAQALPQTKYPTKGTEWGGSDPATQIGWGLNYIASRYKTPMGAWGHEQRVGWYGQGGIFDRPTIIGVGESGPEAVVPLTAGGGMPTTVHEHHYHGPVMQDAAFVRYLEGLGARKGRRG